MCDQSRTEAALREELERLRRRIAELEREREQIGDRNETILRTCSDGFWLIDQDGRILEVNDAYCRMSGYTREELLTMSVHDVEAIETEQEVIHHIRQILASGAHRFESRQRRKDGTMIDLDISTHCLRSDAGKIFTFLRDVTVQKQAERALRESEARYRTLVEHLPAVAYIAALDEASTTLYVSPQVKDLIGFTPEEYKADPDLWRERLHPEDKDRVLKAVIQSHAEKKAFVQEYRMIAKDGRVLWFRDEAVIVKDQNDQPLFLQGVMYDVTEHKKADNALRESEEKYRTLVESAGEAIAIINMNGAFIFINETAAKRLGGTPSDFVGKTMWDLFPKDIADCQMANVREVIKTGRGANVTERTNVRGQLRWYNTTIEPLRDSTGEVAAAMVVARDIHELMQKEAELTKFRAQMARAEQLTSLGTLSATVAHQITQPLTVIRLSLDNALDELMGTSCSSTAIRRLQDSIGQISNITSIINRFRHFARQSSDTRFGEVSLYATADRVVRLLEESARQARVALRLENMDRLPSMSMNETDVEQLFFALLENAIQAADGTIARQVVISGAVNEGQVELRFSDTCGGIAPENLERIFEPFFTTKPRGHGTGLGLCIVQDVVARIGGRIRVESELGKGTTFFVTLPVKESGTSQPSRSAR